jgi:hypothetical protein
MKNSIFTESKTIIFCTLMQGLQQDTHTSQYLEWLSESYGLTGMVYRECVFSGQQYILETKQNKQKQKLMKRPKFRETQFLYVIHIALN